MDALIQRVRGVLVDPRNTLVADVRPAPPWPVAMREHAIPLVGGSAVAAAILGVVFGDGGLGAGLFGVLFTLLLKVVVGVAMLAAMGGITAFFSGMFGGQTDFETAFALVVLSMTPFYLGEAVLPLPAIGGFAALAGVIYALYVFYQGIDCVLGVPGEHRVKHFVLVLVSTLMLSLVVALIIGPLVLTGTP
ncbi:MAG: Yip1 family protein [Azospirillaceae bacterium]